MTTRKPALLLSALLVSLLAGCSTPGPNRGYYVTSEDRDQITRFDPADTSAPVERQDSYLGNLDVPVGMAYDPFTDHFFLRLNPGNTYLVVDRPARRIKRIFSLPADLMPSGVGDIAIRSVDRHLFIAHPAEPVLVEITLHGKYVRSIPLPGVVRPPVAVAYDQTRNRLLTLAPDHPDRVDIRRLDGTIESSVTLDRATDGLGLAFDSKAREFFAALPGEVSGLGIFSSDGHLLRTQPLPTGRGLLSFDVGPHSFLRMF